MNHQCQSQMLYALDGDDLFVLCHYRGGPTPNELQEEKNKQKKIQQEKETEQAAYALLTDEEKEEQKEKDTLENVNDDGTTPQEMETRPSNLPLQFHRYACGDVLCELYPAIAACCPDGTTSVVRKERQTNAKRLFVMAPPLERKNPNANLGKYKAKERHANGAL